MAVAPRVSGKGARTYPVWIGNLKETVKESDLHASFSSLCGSLVSCRVMMDDKGKSKYENGCHVTSAVQQYTS